LEVEHPEQVFLTPNKATIIVALRDDSLHIISLDLVSSLSMGNRPPSRSAS
jgi:hypothetical protein